MEPSLIKLSLKLFPLILPHNIIRISVIPLNTILINTILGNPRLAYLVTPSRKFTSVAKPSLSTLKVLI